MDRYGHELCCTGVLMLVLICPLRFAMADDSATDRVEQLEYDPATGQWVEIEPPQEGTPEGDLAIARRYLTDEEISKARKAVSKWFKTYGADHRLHAQARLVLAEVEFVRRNYYKAHRILRELTAEFGTDEITEKAVESEFVIAEVFLSGTKRKWLGMRLFSAKDVGIEILDEISANFPGMTLGENALKTKADYYFNRGDFDLAEDEYARLVDAYPRSRYLRWASLRRAQAALARFPGTNFDDASLVEAEERFLRFRDGFPTAAEQHDVDLRLEDIRNKRAQKEFEIGQYYVKTNKPQASIFYYRSVIDHWPGTVAASRAQAALAEMNIFYPGPLEPEPEATPTGPGE